MGESSSSAIIPESQNPPLVAPEIQDINTSEANLDQRIEPPQQNEPATIEETTTVEPIQIDNQVGSDDATNEY